MGCHPVAVITLHVFRVKLSVNNFAVRRLIFKSYVTERSGCECDSFVVEVRVTLEEMDEKIGFVMIYELQGAVDT
jgi:hypothetical protein